MASLTVNNLFNVKDMVFVITGGGSGLGESMALALDANGASKVFILGRRQASLDKVAAKAMNNSIIPFACDISSKDQLEAAAKFVEEKAGFVNAVIASSGVLGPVTAATPRAPDAPLPEIQAQLWNMSHKESLAPLDVNVLGAFFTFVAFLNLLDAGNKNSNSRGKKDFIQSQFISISSMAAFIHKESVGYPYMASKAAVSHMTRSLATQFSTMGIRANSIAPGLYVTEMTEFVAGGKDLSIPGSLPAEFIPMTRSGSPEDIAGALLFLVSRAGAFVNGTVLHSDGGTITAHP